MTELPEQESTPGGLLPPLPDSAYGPDAQPLGPVVGEPLRSIRDSVRAAHLAIEAALVNVKSAARQLATQTEQPETQPTVSAEETP